MKLVPGSRERSTSVLTPPTLSSTPSTARACSTSSSPSPLVPVPRRRIVKPLFSAGQPDKRREDAFFFLSLFLFSARVPCYSWPVPRMAFRRPENVAPSGMEMLLANHRGIRRRSELFSIGIERGKWASICMLEIVYSLLFDGIIEKSVSSFKTRN